MIGLDNIGIPPLKGLEGVYLAACDSTPLHAQFSNLTKQSRLAPSLDVLANSGLWFALKAL